MSHISHLQCPKCSCKDGIYKVTRVITSTYFFTSDGVSISSDEYKTNSSEMVTVTCCECGQADTLEAFEN